MAASRASSATAARSCGLTLRPSAEEVLEVRQFFGLPSIQLVEKDWQVVQAISAVLALDASPFRLVFAGGTCLARAHRLVERMSEDVDFKIVLNVAAASKNQQRQALGRLRDRLAAVLTAAGFSFASEPRSRDANQYTVFHLRMDSAAGQTGPLRATIQIELSLAELRQPTVLLPVSSFVSEAYGRVPELARVECVSVTETAAEKAVSLTRRTAMETAGLSRTPDPTLVRHLYDLFTIRSQIDLSAVPELMRAVAQQDALDFGPQHPAYRDNIAGETRRAMTHLKAAPEVRARYQSFVAAMVYGPVAPFDKAIETVAALVDLAWPRQG